MCFTNPALIEGTPLAKRRDVVLGALQGSWFYQSHPERDVHSGPGIAPAPGVIHLGPHSATWDHDSFAGARLIGPVCNAMLTSSFSASQFNTQQCAALCCAAQGCWGMVWGWPRGAVLRSIAIDLWKRIRQKQAKHKKLQRVFSPRTFSYVGLSRT